jgi:hypothetical protein
MQRLTVLEDIKKCCNYLQTDAAINNPGVGGNTEPKLTLLEKSLHRLWRGRTYQECIALSADYKAYVCLDESKDNPRPDNSYGNQVMYSNNNGQGNSFSKNSKKRVLNYWAFTSGIAMEELRQLGIRSIILTSGTLSPLEHMHEEMRLPFRVKLENPHVIDSSQVWVGAVAKGMQGRQLNSSFTVRDTDEYKDEMGNSVEFICRTMQGKDATFHGPELKGGILVFFPSYGVMEKIIARWKQTGCWDRLIHVCGSVVVEPKGSQISGSASSSGARSANSSNSSNNSNSSQTKKKKAADEADDDEDENSGPSYSLGSLQDEFEQGLRRSGRCILMAVCR